MKTVVVGTINDLEQKCKKSRDESTEAATQATAYPSITIQDHLSRQYEVSWPG